MIPKKIHYCWLGNNPLPPLAKKCIATWRKYCPDYEIIRWDESNYDFSTHPYMKQAFDARKWGFVPDYARLDIVHKCGGIYLDTDVELIRPLDDLLNNKCFMGFETAFSVALGLGFGAEAGHEMLQKMMDDYDRQSFLNPDGSLNLLPSPQIQTALLKQYGLQDDNGKIQLLAGETVIYPVDYFCPKSPQRLELKITENTYSIHHYDGSWLPWKKRFIKDLYVFLQKNAPWLIKLRRKILNRM